MKLDAIEAHDRVGGGHGARVLENSHHLDPASRDRGDAEGFLEGHPARRGAMTRPIAETPARIAASASGLLVMPQTLIQVIP